jgi:hypothetical protein
MKINIILLLITILSFKSVSQTDIGSFIFIDYTCTSLLDSNEIIVLKSTCSKANAVFIDTFRLTLKNLKQKIKIPPGIYDLKIESIGFQDYKITDISIPMNNIRFLNLELSKSVPKKKKRLRKNKKIELNKIISR